MHQISGDRLTIFSDTRQANFDGYWGNSYLPMESGGDSPTDFYLGLNERGYW